MNRGHAPVFEMPSLLNRFFLSAAMVLGLMAVSAAHAETVTLAGLLGGKALLVVGTSAPRAMAPGESHRGVTLVSLSGDGAVVELDGARRNLRMGAPVSVGERGASRRVVIAPDGMGHFMQQGQINGKATTFMVDTGASTVGIGQHDAERMGIDFRKGQPVQMRTANGVAQGWRVKLDSVRVGGIELFGIQAVVTPQPMPYVLLGNSFLAEVQMTRTAQQMVLEKR